jgi:predicted dienelactone hydrolase
MKNRGLFNRNIDWDNVTAIGHSSDGATVVALAGSKLELIKAKNILHYSRI